MTRALLTQALSFPPEHRGAVLDDLRARRTTLQEHGCNYWCFEDPGMPGLVIEFLEARDPETLRNARARLDLGHTDSPILTEVEL